MNKFLRNFLILFIPVFFIFTILSLKAEKAFSINNSLKFNKTLCLIEGIEYSKYKGLFAPLNKLIDIEVLDIDLNNKSLKIIPAISDSVDTVENISKANKAIAAINGGFFDVSNRLTVSYITINSKKVGDPNDNINLTSNPNIKPYLKAIFNRTELRVLKCSGKTKYQIAPHNEKSKDCKIVHLLQGGPELIPCLDLEKEAFLAYKKGKKVRESANVTNQDARIAVGLTPQNHMIWVMAKAGYNDNKYYGLTIEELAKLLKYLNVSSALAYDGGSSTTMFVKLPDGTTETSIGDVDIKGERFPAKVKSILVVKKGDSNE